MLLPAGLSVHMTGGLEKPAACLDTQMMLCLIHCRHCACSLLPACELLIRRAVNMSSSCGQGFSASTDAFLALLVALLAAVLMPAQCVMWVLRDRICQKTAHCRMASGTVHRLPSLAYRLSTDCLQQHQGHLNSMYGLQSCCDALNHEALMTLGVHYRALCRKTAMHVQARLNGVIKEKQHEQWSLQASVHTRVSRGRKTAQMLTWMILQLRQEVLVLFRAALASLLRS